MALAWNASQEMRVFLVPPVYWVGSLRFQPFLLILRRFTSARTTGWHFAYAGGSVVLSLLAVFAGLYLARTAMQ